MGKWLLVLVGFVIYSICLVVAYDIGNEKGKIQGHQSALEEVDQLQREQILADVLGLDKEQRLKKIIDSADFFISQSELTASKLVAQLEVINLEDERDYCQEIIRSLNMASTKMVLAQSFAEGGLSSTDSNLRKEFLADAERNFYDGCREFLKGQKSLYVRF